jgi:hypothetical protein
MLITYKSEKFINKVNLNFNITVDLKAVRNIRMPIHTPTTIATTHQIHIVTYNFRDLKGKIVRRILFYMTPFSMYICPINDLKTQI